MRVLDLFSGLGGFSKAFKERGHDVLTLDINKKFKPDVCMDILKVKSTAYLYNEQETEDFDVILASPPCEAFSLSAGFMHRWAQLGNGQYYPYDAVAEHALKIAKKTFALCQKSGATFWVIENPRGYMRHLIRKPDMEITQCQYGRKWMKPTDLWGKIPESFVARKCKNGSKCHISAGHPANEFSRTSLRKKLSTPADRAELPHGFSLELCMAMEKDNQPYIFYREKTDMRVS